MLKSIVVSTAMTKFSALAFQDNFADSIAKIAKLGFDAVELAVRDPNCINPGEIQEVLLEYHLFVPAIGTGQAYGEEGLSFTSAERAVRRQAVRRIREQMDLARQLGGAQVIIGLIRGRAESGVSPELAESYFVAAMQECAVYQPEILLTVEPINRYETNLYNDTVSVRRIIDKIDRPNVKILYDTFHMNIEEPDMIRAILASRHYISHVHFADSNRWAPGCGHLDFGAVIAALREIGYDKAISAEILPQPSPEESAGLTMEFFKRMNL